MLGFRRWGRRAPAGEQNGEDDESTTRQAVLAREDLGDDDAGVAGGEQRRRECYGAAAAVRFDLGLMGNEEGGRGMTGGAT